MPHKNKKWVCPEVALYSVALGKKMILPGLNTYTKARKFADKHPGSMVKLGNQVIRKIK